MDGGWVWKLWRIKRISFITFITAVTVLSRQIWLLQVSFPCDAAQVQPKRAPQLGRLAL
jgi:hypothetical protein